MIALMLGYAHAASLVYEPVGEPSRRLFVFLGGARGKPEVNDLLLGMAADAGFRAISLEYENTPIEGPCKSQPDDCEELFRLETLYGVDVSPVVDVPWDDSIEGRLVADLATLGWTEYVDDAGLPLWSEIVASGFSQGGAYVGLLARDVVPGGVLYFDTLCDGAITKRGKTKWDPWCFDARPPETGPESFAFIYETGALQSKLDLAATWGIPVEQVVTTDVPAVKDHGALTSDNLIPLDVDGIPVLVDVYADLFASLNALP